jgi:DNA-binding ferritin-like protein
MAADARRATLLDVWAALRALHHVLWTLHWQAEGDPAYGDHLLYQRLYEARVEEIDRMAELIAGLFGAGALDPAASWQRAGALIDGASAVKGKPATRALALVEATAEAIDLADKANTGAHALAANNVLAGIADNLDNAAYLLQQRAR